MTDPLRIHLSLVSHTNIGKTTLARTLLMRDVGEIADRAHVTETTDDYVLARAVDGSELVLWDTPGFGNSVQLAKRLEGRSNPVGWFLSEVWDRFANKAFWLDQRAVRHIRDTSSIVLYLVNVEEVPARSPYVPAEMKILSWIGKPVIVLLNQMGPPREAHLEEAEINEWKTALKPYPFVTDVLPMDAFARCWVQESALFDAIGKALPNELQAAFAALRTVWLRGRCAIYSSSVEAIARHIRLLLCASEPIPSLSLKERALGAIKLDKLAKRFGFAKSEHEERQVKNARDILADAQTALASEAADSFCALTNKLIEINGLKGKGVSKEILRRMKTDWQVATYSVDTASATAIGTGLGAASGAAAAGLTVDASMGGLTLGLGTLIGGLIGAIGGLGAATAYNLHSDKKGTELAWSKQAISNFILEAVLLYLAVAHFGRGRGEWTESESPNFWKTTTKETISEYEQDFNKIRSTDSYTMESQLTSIIDSLLRKIFKQLYGIAI